jgi:hypothetical protein
LARSHRERIRAPAGDDDAMRRRETLGDREADAGAAAADQSGSCGDGSLLLLVYCAVPGLA